MQQDYSIVVWQVKVDPFIKIMFFLHVHNLSAWLFVLQTLQYSSACSRMNRPMNEHVPTLKRA